MASNAWRGLRRGPGEEGYRLFRMGVAYVFGCGFYGVMASGLHRALSLSGDIAGPVGFAGVIIGVWYLTRFVKRSLTSFLAARFAGRARTVGAAAGALRSFLVVLSIAGVFYLAGGAPGRAKVAEDSLVGKIASLLMPGSRGSNPENHQ